MEQPAWVTRRTAKWNRAIDFAMNPCNATISVYFEAFRPAAGKALITLLSFGLDDVARGLFRPKGIYPHKCLGRRKRGRHSVGIPELGEEIGKRIPGADVIKGRTFGSVEKFLWVADGVSQRVFFWVMIGDIVTDFVSGFTTGVYKQGFCNKTGSGQYLNEGITFFAHPIFAPGWQIQSHGVVKYDTGTFGNMPNHRSTGGSGPIQAFAQWTFTPALLSSINCDVAISAGLPEQSETKHVSVAWPSTQTITLQVSSRGGRAHTAIANASPTDSGNATVQVFHINQPP